MRIMRSVLSATAVATLALGTATAFAASASPPLPTPRPRRSAAAATRRCNSAAVGSRGTVYLTYNAATGKNCVATIRSTPGTATDMSAWLYVPDTEAYDEDYGKYTSYRRPHLRLRQGPLRGLGRQHRQRQRPDHRLQLRRPRRTPGHHRPVIHRA
ncbi:Spore-associated protein OS=Streptomyces tendae OX=1932 GN=GUR47_24405 PE=4 SV=1 [Streptomyces tendae]